MPRGVYDRVKVRANQQAKKESMSKSKTIDATSEVIEGREREFTVEGIVTQGPPEIEIAPVDALSGTTLDQEAFMAEVLDVHLHEPAAENESKHVFIGVNSEPMWLERGRSYKLKRKHVAVLAQAKSGRINQRKVIAPDGSQSYLESEISSLSFPFSVLHDPNPRGGTWLLQTLKQAY